LKKDGTPTEEELCHLIDGEMEKVGKGQKYVKIFNGGSWFWDEVPVNLRQAAYKYLEGINFKHLRVENTFNLMHWDEVKELKDRGFDLTISWGFEAADDRILKEIDKGVTLAKVEKMLFRAKEMGVKSLLYLMAGLPTTTKEDFFHTVDWLKERMGTFEELSVLTYVPMKGSYYYDNVWKTNQFRVITKEDWRACREYIKNAFEGTGVDLTFTTYQWRYMNGKTYNEMYKKKSL
jgi:radical SAM enzyme (TIGR01210 family)